MHKSEESEAVYDVTPPKDYAVTYSNEEMSHHTIYGVKPLLLYATTFKFTRDDLSESALRRNIGDKGNVRSQRNYNHIIGSEIVSYSFYYPPENNVFVPRNAEFLENSLITQEACGSLDDLEIIHEEDTHPSENTSIHHDKGDQEIDEPQSDVIPIRRSTRTRYALDRMCLYIDDGEYKTGDLNEPGNYKTTLLDPESDKWLEAMNVEMQSMKDNEVWDLVDLPPNGKTIGSKWLFKKKTNMDGAVHTYKARLVAKGFTQTYEVDYEETFSPVADIRAIRILIAIVAFYDYEIWQTDVKNAFLNVHLSEEVYMVQPEGFVNPKYPNQVCKLKRSIYELNDIKRELRVSCYTDAEYMTDVDDLKSQTEYVFVLNGETKCIAASYASKEAVWVRKFISRLRVVPTIEEPIKMYCDITGSITTTNESRITKGARYYRAKVHYYNNP
ncbi:retrotransposon protein, putative, ty1-copia subclass [Tanacetum coccineum]|uniref:Retrotransposon protein, putative, ty1-copia subclass n=1 Tax=Tanacetum coccineum TaxID=301880 RepID=A0ABQ4XJA3_9ASTR